MERPRTPFGPPKPQYVAPEHRYTTLDEIHFLRDLQRRGKLDVLRVALRNAPYRVWYGPGMEVDPITVITTMREIVEEMEAGQ